MWHQPMRATLRAAGGHLPMTTQASHSLSWTLSPPRYAPPDNSHQVCEHFTCRLARPVHACLVQAPNIVIE